MQAQRRRRIVLGIVLMVVGGLVGAVGIAGAAVTGARAVTGGRVVELPGTDSGTFDAGQYRIFVHEGALTTASVSCDDGQQPEVGDRGAVSETITRGGRTYEAEATFHLDHGARCDVAMGGFGSAVVTHSVTSTLTKASRWALLIVPGGLVLVLGFVLLLVGLIAKPKAAGVPLAPPPAWGAAPPPPAPPAAMPQGWYPDPGGSGRQRWWDGQRWTEHVS